MTQKFCIRLPFLHAGFRKEMPEMFLHLCPGIQGGEGYWTPPNYVFDGKQAQKLLDDMREASLQDVENMRIALNPGVAASEAAFRGEMDDLAKFAGGDAHSGVSLKLRLLLEQAQKILIWIWLQEEVFADITSLSRDCANTDALLRGQFTETPEILPAHAEKMFEPDTSLMPSWRVCAANAALFVPPDVPFLAEGQMRRDLLEDFTFLPVGESSFSWFPSLPEGILFIREPLWKVIGHSGPDTVFSHSDWGLLENCYNHDRIWLTERDE